MREKVIKEKQRQRAPSKRSLETRARILDAAERVFAEQGFEGASIRDIASQANVQVGLVNHHGGPKENLFALTVARRANELSALRQSALLVRKRQGPLSVQDIMTCFFGPYLKMAETGGPQWLAYARLVAQVSSEPRWRGIAAECFDPTANQFIDEIFALFPDTSRKVIATGFVYSVAAMLAQITSNWRIRALGDDNAPSGQTLKNLVSFCSAGINACVERDLSS